MTRTVIEQSAQGSIESFSETADERDRRSAAAAAEASKTFSFTPGQARVLASARKGETSAKR